MIPSNTPPKPPKPPKQKSIQSTVFCTVILCLVVFYWGVYAATLTTEKHKESCELGVLELRGELYRCERIVPEELKKLFNSKPPTKTPTKNTQET